MSIQIEQIDLLHRVMQLEANVHIRNAIVSVIDRIRMPMSEILALVPGESAAARSRAIGISRQTYYAWVREENRPLTDQAEHLARITGVPANLISARSYLESANDAGGEVAEAERECDEREIDARQDEDEKRAKEEQSEAELNKAWAEALERCAGNLAADLAARNSPRSPPATSRPASVA